ncbi:ankyrin repeat domain-containing protein [Ottowia thiooxydans]|uniref:ankyrin repeat domain-containing protein n=1 Tax=Ottowia thiooxydans TaxID=219182 RepID=UPI00146B40B6|nr:ankyrin repeat domain-containing protein [Ottowia thiooxydans]
MGAQLTAERQLEENAQHVPESSFDEQDICILVDPSDSSPSSVETESFDMDHRSHQNSTDVLNRSDPGRVAVPRPRTRSERLQSSREALNPSYAASLSDTTQGPFTRSKHTPTHRNRLTPLMTASQSGEIELVKSLLKQPDAQVNAKLIPSGQSALTLAINRKHQNVVDALLESKANPNSYIPGGTSALGLAIGSKQPVAVEALLNAGAQANATFSNEVTPLTLVATKGCLDTLYVLLKMDPESGSAANLNAALRVAANFGHVEFVNALLQLGAVASAKTLQTLVENRIDANPACGSAKLELIALLKQAAQRNCWNFLDAMLEFEIPMHPKNLFAAPLWPQDESNLSEIDGAFIHAKNMGCRNLAERLLNLRRAVLSAMALGTLRTGPPPHSRPRPSRASHD